MSSDRRFLSALTVALLLAVSLVVAGAPVPAAAAVLPAGFREQTVLTGLDQPMNLEFAADGRVFVAEKGGRIKVYDNLADTTATVFADLSANVHNQGDRGLLGLALHPQFPAQPYVYVLYTYDAPPGQTAPVWNDNCTAVGGTNGGRCIVTGRLSRLRAAGDVMTGPEQVLLQDWCQQYSSHSIGDLHFGADGMLYVSAGDGASFNAVDYGQLGTPANPCGDPAGQGGALRAQDVRTTGDPTGLDGTILRLDANTGSAAPGNPAAASTDVNTRRVVAHGLRNPFRFAMRPATSEVWLGDVGWNTWEEINRLAAPTAAVADFGWPCFEGTGRQGGYDSANLAVCEGLYTAGGQTGPYYAYQHTATVVPGEGCPTGGSSTSGAAFYPASGGEYPAAYRGALFFADYTRDCIWAMQPAAAGGLPDATRRVTFVAGAANPVDLTIGPGGDLYYVDAGGTVRRIRYFAGNQPPTAVATADPTTGTAPLTVTFDGRGSTDPDPADEGLLRFEWDFTNDGTVDARTPTATYTYPPGGPYTARLLVRDTLDAIDTQLIAIQSGNSEPQAVIDTPPTGTTFAVGQSIAFTGHATDPDQGALPVSALRWRLLQYHCFSLDSCHVHTAQEWTGVSEASFPAPDHEYPSYLELVLTATDAGGLTATSTVRLDPRTVALTFTSNPPGLQLSVGSTAQVTPFTRTVIQGSQNTVSAVTPQPAGGVPNVYAAWSDGGSQTHVITAPGAARTYTATFVTQRLPQSRITAVSADSWETVGENGFYANVRDGNPATYWHTKWNGADPPHPHQVILDLGALYSLTGLYYLPRQNSANGRIARYEIYTSTDGATWGGAAATGTWPNSTAEQAVTFAARTGRYLRLRSLSEVNGHPWASVAELNVAVAPRRPQASMRVRSADSQQPSSPATNVLDGNTATIWHTAFGTTNPPPPHEIQLDLGRSHTVSCVYYLPRQDMSNGRIANYEVYTSADGTAWGTPAATGTWRDTTAEQNACFGARAARYVRIRALTEVAGRAWTSAAEFGVIGR